MPEIATPNEETITSIATLGASLVGNVGQIMIGKSRAIELLTVCLLCEGHVLIEAVPGVGKTTLARAVARSISGEFRRIQFTPDLLPSDISGISLFDQRVGDFRFRPGPVFANVVLADEINRATPRTQSSLLEAMEERTVTIDGETMALPRPFLVLATENPVELEGTFPLPEAQLDRFLMRIALGYPDQAEELTIVARNREGVAPAQIEPVISGDELMHAAATTRQVHVAPDVANYLIAIVRGTRAHNAIALGASPRASIALYRTSQALAALRGRDFVTPDDVKTLIAPVLLHRIVLSSDARLRGRILQTILDEVVNAVPVPVEGSAGLAAPGGARASS